VGIDVPVLDGRVRAADEKSMLFPCVRKSICVCPRPAPLIAAATHTHLSAVLLSLMSLTELAGRFPHQPLYAESNLPFFACPSHREVK
jgi:hypothetical protein